MRSTGVARRLILSTLDLVLVTALLLAYGSGRWAWVCGPLSAIAIWITDCSKRRVPQPAGSRLPVRLRERAGALE
jgi:hypothetical protein